LLDYSEVGRPTRGSGGPRDEWASGLDPTFWVDRDGSAVAHEHAGERCPEAVVCSVMLRRDQPGRLDLGRNTPGAGLDFISPELEPGQESRIRQKTIMTIQSTVWWMVGEVALA